MLAPTFIPHLINSSSSLSNVSLAMGEGGEELGILEALGQQVWKSF